MPGGRMDTPIATAPLPSVTRMQAVPRPANRPKVSLCDRRSMGGAGVTLEIGQRYAGTDGP